MRAIEPHMLNQRAQGVLKKSDRYIDYMHSIGKRPSCLRLFRRDYELVSGAIRSVDRRVNAPPPIGGRRSGIPVPGLAAGIV